MNSSAQAGSVSTIMTGLSSAHMAYAGGASSADAASIASSNLSSAFDQENLSQTVLFALVVDLLDLGCNAEDVDTSILRSSGYCHTVGDYCSTRIPLIGCIQNSRSNCCFNSKLARIIHEQGRPQFITFASNPDGIWGEIKNPDCRGFTPEEFQSLDFSQMDLSEYYNELATNTAADMEAIIQGGTNEFVQNNGL